MITLMLIAGLLMLVFSYTKRKPIGFLSWIILSLVWVSSIPWYMSLQDYFNVCVMIAAFVVFMLVAFTILKSDNVELLADVTRFSALAVLFYYPFAAFQSLKMGIINEVIVQTIALSKALGFDVVRPAYNVMALNGRSVKIILACTGIESMALFAGATLGVKADLKRRVAAFMVSVPVIYFLNLLRNVFVLAAYGCGWFGSNSFYIAHNVICKVLATLALVLIALAVFRILPELADLIAGLEDEIREVWFG